MKILIVDDDPIMLTMLEHILTGEGYSVAAVRNGQEALETWRDEHLPVVVADWMMPGMDGEALCREIRAAPADHYTYFIMLTSREEQEAVVAGLAAGADDYVKKPFDHKELLLRVKAGVRVAELERALAHKIGELQQALNMVRTLEGLLPICAYCKKIRDDEGYWREVEQYIADHTDASFSHGFCPACYEKYIVPQLDDLSPPGKGAPGD